MRTRWDKRVSRQIRGDLRRRWVLKKSGFGIAANTRNGTLLVDPGDFTVSRMLLETGEYDYLTVRLLASLAGRDSRLVFVGAHIGALVVPITAMSAAQDVMAFEPNPETFTLLKCNLALNGLTRVRAVMVGAGEEVGVARFTHNAINTGNSRVSEQGDITVNLVRLDDVLPPQPITLLVMDVEGYEVAAMRGAQEVLERTENFFVEFAPEQLKEQGASVDQFCDLVRGKFTVAYVVHNGIPEGISGDFCSWLKALPPKRGQLLNLLLRRTPLRGIGWDLRNAR